MSIDRRTFTWQAGSWLAAGLTAWPATSHGYLANDTLQIGLIGFGGRCRHLLGALREIPGTRVTAVCDVFDRNLAAGKEVVGPEGFATKDYRELLARADVDAVVIATPDHHHVPITVAACAAGKDVYVEKPLTHDLSEGQAVIDAEKKHRRIVQVGTQQRSMPHLQEAREVIASGRIGKVHKVHMTWNRNHPRGFAAPSIDPASVDWRRFLGSAPSQPFDPFRMAEWRWFWDFGGGLLTDLMVHWMDVVNWYLDLGTPASAHTIGDHFQPGSKWETPDTIQTLVHYPKEEVQVYFEGTFVNRRNRAMTEFMGTEGTLYIDRGRYEIHPEDGSEPVMKILGSGERGQDFYDQPPAERLHLENWLQSVRSRETPRCPATEGVRSVWASHLGNQALRTGGGADWSL